MTINSRRSVPRATCEKPFLIFGNQPSIICCYQTRNVKIPFFCYLRTLVHGKKILGALTRKMVMKNFIDIGFEILPAQKYNKNNAIIAGRPITKHMLRVARQISVLFRFFLLHVSQFSLEERH